VPARNTIPIKFFNWPIVELFDGPSRTVYVKCRQYAQVGPKSKL
jgi:hypothetical protein